MKPKRNKTALKPVTFEAAMVWLRQGKPIRRRMWHPNSLIFRIGSEVFVKLPSGPQQWRPYTMDILATDWAKV